MTSAAAEGRVHTDIKINEPNTHGTASSSSPPPSTPNASDLATQLLAHGKFQPAASHDDLDDTTEFYKIVNEADAADFKDFLPPDPGIDVDSIMCDNDCVNLMDVLQSAGVDVVDASKFVASIRRQPRNTLVEVFGQGNIIKWPTIAGGA